MSDKAIPQLASEICTLAHRGWEHLPNTEVLFRAIGERAQKISELAVECRAPAPQPAINRFELIDWTADGRFGCGRVTTIWEKPEEISIRYQLQDGGRTLKVFVSDGAAATPQVTPTFPDCNVGTAHECCVARMKRLEKEQYGQIWEGTSEQASPTPEIAADPKVLRDVTAAVEDIKNGNTLSLEEAFQNVECGQFPPQYLTCPRSGCKGVVLFLQGGGPPWRAYAYSCDESECPNHSKWLMFVDHYWGKAVYASPPVMSSILFLAPNVESHILDCIFRCSRCGQTKWGIWSDEATVGFYVHKHFDKELESEQLTFECDDCALKSKP